MSLSMCKVSSPSFPSDQRPDFTRSWNRSCLTANNMERNPRQRFIFVLINFPTSPVIHMGLSRLAWAHPRCPAAPNVTVALSDNVLDDV